MTQPRYESRYEENGHQGKNGFEKNKIPINYKCLSSISGSRGIQRWVEVMLF
jgi:hypothetical protein